MTLRLAHDTCHDCGILIIGEIFYNLQGQTGCEGCSQECVKCPGCCNDYSLPIGGDKYRCVRCGESFEVDE